MASEEEIWFAAQRDAGNNDDDDDGYDEELLRHVPHANDDDPDMPFHDSFKSLEPPPTKVQDEVSQPVTAHRFFTDHTKEEIGVCDFPPLSRTSFMLRGDNGAVRWLTASGLDKKRKRRRDEDAPGESMIDMRSYMDSFPDNGDHHSDDSDEDGGGPQDVARELRRLRGGVDGGLGFFDISSLLQQMYEDAEKVTREEPLDYNSIGTNSNHGAKAQMGTNVENTLWATKYTPRSFRELLSDESINLRLLQWIKSWDPYVFHGTDAERPEERLAVLVGPPGVGKTTLAHVLAAHCGYEPIEINASVDRTTAKLEAAIQLAVAPALSRRRVPFDVAKNQSHTRSHSKNDTNSTDNNIKGSVNGSSLVDRIMRPKCLIIDEMDGIAANVANFLLKQDIHCPVFCLCNDFYVPSLRPLRRECQHVYHFSALRPQRLLSRLEEIVEREGLALAQPLLADLAQSSNGDVRCCLNTLQFFYLQAAHPSSAVNNKRSPAQVMREMQGKDAKLGLWDAWRTVFQREERGKYIQRLRKEYAVDYETLVMTAMSQHTGPQGEKRRCAERVSAGFRVDPGYMYVSRALQQCSDMDTLLDGLQEHYLQRPYADYTFQRTRDVSAAFSYHDCLLSAAYRSGGASAALIPLSESNAAATAALCFAHCASAARAGPLGFPRASADCARRLAESAHIARSFRDGCRGAVAAHLSADAAVACDAAPLLLRCLVDAALRPPAHSGAAMAPQEKQRMAAAAERFAAYGLTYTRGKNVRSHAAEEEDKWELDPPLHKLGGVTLDAKRKAGGEVMAVGMKEDLKLMMVAEIQRCVLQNGLPGAGREKTALQKKHLTAPAETHNVKKKAEELVSTATLASTPTSITNAATTHNDTPSSIKSTVDAAVERKRPREEGKVEAAGQVANPKSTVKRDFFGRPIVDSGKKINAKGENGTNSASALNVGSRKTKLTVQYTYHDGSTNAVRIPATFDDF